MGLSDEVIQDKIFDCFAITDRNVIAMVNKRIHRLFEEYYEHQMAKVMRVMDKFKASANTSERILILEELGKDVMADCNALRFHIAKNPSMTKALFSPIYEFQFTMVYS